MGLRDKLKGVKSSDDASPKVLDTFFQAQLSGRSNRSLNHLPKAVFRRLQSRSNGMAGFCLDLQKHLEAVDVAACKETLCTILHQICEATNVHFAASCESFVLCGGEALLLRVLSSSFTLPVRRGQSNCRHVTSLRRSLLLGRLRSDSSAMGRAATSRPALGALRNDCLAILQRLCFTLPFFSEALASQHDLLIRLFSLMASNITFDNAVSLAEEILAVREETLSLNDIPRFAELVRSFSSRQLAFFCRVLAMVVFEPDERQPEVGAAAKVSAGHMLAKEKEPEMAVADSNQDVLLAIPEILSRLVRLLQVKGLPFSQELAGFQETAARFRAALEGVVDIEPLGPLEGLRAVEAGDWAELDGNDMTVEDSPTTLAGNTLTTLGMLDLGMGDEGLGDEDRPLLGGRGTVGFPGGRWTSEEGEEREDESRVRLGLSQESEAAAVLTDWQGGPGPRDMVEAPVHYWRMEEAEGGPAATTMEEQSEPSPPHLQRQGVPRGFWEGWQGLFGWGEGRTQAGTDRPQQGIAANTEPGPAGQVVGPQQLQMPQRQGRWTGLALFGGRNETPQDPVVDRAAAAATTLGATVAGQLVQRTPAAGTEQLRTGPRVMLFVGNPPQLLGEVPEGGVGPFLESLPGLGVNTANFPHREAQFMERHGASLRVLTLAAHQVEVLFVLCALCGGKRKEHVQDQLAELGLARALSRIFDRLNWTPVPPATPEPHGIHGPGCACNTEQALKIQYLRLVHNFCDRENSNHSNKRLLAVPGGALPAAGKAPPKGDALIHKILKVLMAEPADSVYRFWLASCVEAFLRGSDPRDQEFVASTGLMDHLVGEILKGGFKCAAWLQINFDLLGELIKFNPTMFSRLDHLLTPSMLERFIEILTTHIIDSNVFIRSVVLSLEFFRRGSPPPPYTSPPPPSQAIWAATAGTSAITYTGGLAVATLGPCISGSFGGQVLEGNEGLLCFDESNCKIASFMSCNYVRLLKDLMVAVSLAEINQDNICVLNTALLFFIFAERNNALASCLAALRDAAEASCPPRNLAGAAHPQQTAAVSCSEADEGCSEIGCTRHMFGNFFALLEFWREYYRRKRGRDCATLQYSSSVPFSEWQRVVDLLCLGPKHPTSLLYVPSMLAHQQEPMEL